MAEQVLCLGRPREQFGVEQLETEPAAGLFFDGLAQLYRNAFLKWIDATKRRPELRAPRIAEMVDLLKAGKKERPPST